MLYGIVKTSIIRDFCLFCLNPYFFGKCSTAKHYYCIRKGVQMVLILIFLENALRHPYFRNIIINFLSLNPYFFGKCSTANNKPLEGDELVKS